MLSEEAERYVVLQESLIVLESEGSNGLTRVVGIAKENNAEGWLYSELFDVANKIGDKDLAERIQNIISSEKKKGTMMEDFDLDNDMESMMEEAEREYENDIKETQRQYENALKGNKRKRR